jgi:hypothetical protein
METTTMTQSHATQPRQIEAECKMINIDSGQLNYWALYVWTNGIVPCFWDIKNDITVASDAVADIAVGALEKFVGDISPADRSRLIDKLSFALELDRANQNPSTAFGFGGVTCL